MKNIYVLSLGCPRNLVDSEVLIGQLRSKGFSVTDTVEGADIAIINTCGFIDDAKKESTDHILQLAEIKRTGGIGRLIVMGCLAQRYPVELMDGIREIDGMFGTSDFIGIAGNMENIIAGHRIKKVTPDLRYLYDHRDNREILTPGHSAYVKIQEGCSNCCSYCVIPRLRGPRRSRIQDSIIREIRGLRKRSPVREITIIGQDTTSFDMERTGRSGLEGLLREVSAVMDGGWVRLLYTHPAHFTDGLIDVISSEENICNYVDLPIQHINDRILRRMNRRVTRKGITSLINRIRGGIEGVVLRTSVIVGFPGETDEDFSELMDFIEQVKFERLGAFIYSREDGTPAGSMPGQVPENVKRQRFARVMELQQRISETNNRKLLGTTLEVLIDGRDASDPSLFTGRSRMDAPEVDGVVYVRGKDVREGAFMDVRITGFMEYDLMGEPA